MQIELSSSISAAQRRKPVRIKLTGSMEAGVWIAGDSNLLHAGHARDGNGGRARCRHARR